MSERLVGHLLIGRHEVRIGRQGDPRFRRCEPSVTALRLTRSDRWVLANVGGAVTVPTS